MSSPLSLAFCCSSNFKDVFRCLCLVVVIVGVIAVSEGVLVIGFFSSIFVIVTVELGKEEDKEDEEDEFSLDKHGFVNRSLSDGVCVLEFFFTDEGSEELSSDETSNGSNVSEPKFG